MKKAFLRFLAAALCLMCLLSLVPMASFADVIDTDKDCSLTIIMKYEGKAIPQCSFAICRVADVSEDAVFTASGPYKDYTGTLNGLKTADDWDKAAEDVRKYTNDENIAPLMKAKTDSTGKVTVNGLKPGLYLVVAGESTVGDKLYTAKPCLVCVPGRGSAHGEWVYEDVQVIVKAGEKEKPETKPSEKPNPLPPTGMLWWPVAVLLVAGLLCMVIGAVRRRSSNDETER